MKHEFGVLVMALLVAIVSVLAAADALGGAGDGVESDPLAALPGIAGTPPATIEAVLNAELIAPSTTVVADPPSTTVVVAGTTAPPTTGGRTTAPTTRPPGPGPTATTTTLPGTTTTVPPTVTTTTLPTTTTTTTVPPTTTTTIPATTTTLPPTTTTTIPATTTTLPPTTTTTAPPTTRQATYRLVGGTVTIRFGGGSVRLLSATPADGFTAAVGSGGPKRVEVTFSNDAHLSSFAAWMENGELVVVIDES